MPSIWKIAPWLERIALAVPTLFFFVIGWLYFSNPVQTTARDLITLGSAAAVTDMRAIGAIFLACGLVTLFCLTTTERLLLGFYFVLVVVAMITIARAIGVFVDGAAPETLSKLTTEVVLIAVFLAGCLLELARRRRQAEHARTSVLPRIEMTSPEAIE